MYTNINTKHAVDVLAKWFELHCEEIPDDFPLQLVLQGIERLMNNNVFSFGDRYFLQRNGTAMGTNVACAYATIYYSYHEETDLQHRSFIRFYRRLIDDAFIIFSPIVPDYENPFLSLTTAMNNYGPTTKRLNWDTEPPQQTVNFLDLTVSITKDGTIATKTFQKKDNTYLYRPPTSCQPPSILKSFVYGTPHRYY